MRRMVTILVDPDGIRVSLVSSDGIDRVASLDQDAMAMAVTLWARLTHEVLPERVDPSTWTHAAQEAREELRRLRSVSDQVMERLVTLTAIIEHAGEQMARLERFLSSQRPVSREDIHTWLHEAQLPAAPAVPPDGQ